MNSFFFQNIFFSEQNEESHTDLRRH